MRENVRMQRGRSDRLHSGCANLEDLLLAVVVVVVVASRFFSFFFQGETIDGESIGGANGSGAAISLRLAPDISGR